MANLKIFLVVWTEGTTVMKLLVTASSKERAAGAVGSGYPNAHTIRATFAGLAEPAS